MITERSGHPHYPDSTDFDQTLYVVSCGYSFLEDADHHFVTRRPRGRDDYHFLYVASGSVHVWIRGQEQIAKEGTLIYYKLGDPQQYFQDPLSRPEVYWLHFSGRKAGQFIQDLGFQESGLFFIGKNAQVVELWESILRELQLKKLYYFKICAGYLMQLLTCAARLLREGHHASWEKEERWSQVLALLNNDYQSSCPVEEYANIVGLSKYRFIKNFKTLTGRTPIEYRNRVRIQHAQMLLQDTACSILEIGERTGFESSSYFSSTFKRYTGVSPAQYRKTMAEPQNAKNEEFSREKSFDFFQNL